MSQYYQFSMFQQNSFHFVCQPFSSTFSYHRGPILPHFILYKNPKYPFVFVPTLWLRWPSINRQFSRLPLFPLLSLSVCLSLSLSLIWDLKLIWIMKAVASLRCCNPLNGLITSSTSRSMNLWVYLLLSIYMRLRKNIHTCLWKIKH